jgi:urease accessory protein UreF
MRHPISNPLPEARPVPGGDPRPLLEQLGAEVEAASLDTAERSPALQKVHTVEELRRFLTDYQERILLPLDWPTILLAYGHASRNELRELVALDRRLHQENAWQEFAPASCRVGQRQLHRLRPLRDLRFVQRYNLAIEDGKAAGWHTLVFGIALHTFSLPLRQGLMHYASQTTQGFVQSRARALAWPEGLGDDLTAECAMGWPNALNLLLAQSQQPQLTLT